jgi:putative ABC transport system ATP-binding protein
MNSSSSASQSADDWEWEDEPPPLVRITGLNHYFGHGESRKQILVNNNLKLHPGELVIMTGPSGSGKTTLLTLIGALRSVQEGSLHVFGQELSGLPPARMVDVRRRIGFIFQAHNLFDALTATQNVLLALELFPGAARAKHRKAVEILTQLGLGQRLHYKPQALSGGQRQRVAIARALVNRPQLVLADEPTAALDKESGRDVVTLLQNLAREQRSTILMVTHDNRILDVADRIVTLVDGLIVSNVAVKEALLLCEFLSKCPMFQGLALSVLSGMAEKMSRERFRAGTTIFRQGAAGDKFYVIRRGACEVIIEDGGSSRLVRTMGVGDFFGELALLTGNPRSATIVAREKTELYVLGKTEFQATIDASSDVKEQLLRVLFQRQ